MTAELRALIFDVDGTLADTEEFHRRAFNAVFAAAGLVWWWNRSTYRDLLSSRAAASACARSPSARTHCSPRDRSSTNF